MAAVTAIQQTSLTSAAGTALLMCRWNLDHTDTDLETVVLWPNGEIVEFEDIN